MIDPSRKAKESAEQRRDRLLSKAFSSDGKTTISSLAIVGYERSRAVRAKPVRWFWESRIADYHVGEIAGPSGGGKSALVFLLAAAAAAPEGSSTMVLGAPVHAIPDDECVLLANAENGEQSAVYELDAAFEMLGIDPVRGWEKICLLSRTGLLAHETTNKQVVTPNTQWSAVMHAAYERAFGIGFFDTRARIFKGFGASKEEEAQAAVAECVAFYQRLSGGPAVVVSHTRKGGGNDLEDVSGHTQRAAAADFIIMVAPEKDDGRVVSSKIHFEKLRDSFGKHPDPVTFSKAVDDSGRWRLGVNESAQPADRPAHERIFQLLLREEMTARQIRDALKMSGARVKQALDLLKAEKRVTWSKRIVAGRETWFARSKGDLLREIGLVKSAHEPRSDVESEVDDAVF